MINIFKFAFRLLFKIKAAGQQSIALIKLNEFRAANPSCTIMSDCLSEVSVGERVAILDRTVLDRVRIGNFSSVLSDSRLVDVNIGNFSYVANNSQLNNVNIGNFCSIGLSVNLGLARHPSRVFVSTYPAFFSDQNTSCPLSFRKDKIFDDSVPKTTIGHDVWVGSNVILPGGINIGTGSIIAAGAVVVKDVPPYAVVGGNPAKIIRYRFSDAQIEVLLASEWWNWSIEKIVRNVDNFSDVDKFMAAINVDDKK